MARTLRRIGRLGIFVAMAGVSWVVEACGKTSTQPRLPDGSSGSGNPATGGNGGTSPAATGGSSTGGTVPTETGGTGGEGGLHDLPCE